MKYVFMCLSFLLLVACATNLPSKYDHPRYDDCLIVQIARERGMRLETAGDVLKGSGIILRKETDVSTDDIIEVYSSIESVLTYPGVTGAVLVAELMDLDREYAELVDIALPYIQPLDVPKPLDPCSIDILKKFVQDRIKYYEALRD